MSLEDLIADEDVVITVTRGGYTKRTKVGLYRQQRRGGRGVQGATLRADDVVEHVVVASTHAWLLVFTDQGRVYRCRAHEIPEQLRSAKGVHLANVLSFAPDERVAEVLAISDYGDAPYLMLCSRGGLVKRTPLTDYDSPRSSGLAALALRDGDSLLAAGLVGEDDHVLLVGTSGKAIKFRAGDLRPTGRATQGVKGMDLDGGDELLGMLVVEPGQPRWVLTATANGLAKRTDVLDYPLQGRGGKGVLTHKIDRGTGRLVAALAVSEGDDLYALTTAGGVIRTQVDEQALRSRSRNVKGVRLVRLPAGEQLVAVAGSPDSPTEDE